MVPGGLSRMPAHEHRADITSDRWMSVSAGMSDIEHQWLEFC